MKNIREKFFKEEPKQPIVGTQAQAAPTAQAIPQQTTAAHQPLSSPTPKERTSIFRSYESDKICLQPDTGSDSESDEEDKSNRLQKTAITKDQLPKEETDYKKTFEHCLAEIKQTNRNSR